MSDSQEKPPPEQNVATLPTRAQTKRLKECTTLSEAFQTDEIKRLIAQAIPRAMNPDAMLRTWILAATKNPDLFKCDLRQALGAFQSLAILGLHPNTHLNEADIIPFRKTKWNEATRKREFIGYDLNIFIRYGGYLTLGHRAGAVKSIHADVVYDPDREGFSREYGTDQHLRHRGRPHGYSITGKTPQLAYCYVRMAEGEIQFDVMDWPEIMTIRNGSQAYIRALRIKRSEEAKQHKTPSAYLETPWVRNENEMAKKTVARRLFKWLPKSPELAAAVALEDAQDDHGGLDFGPVIDGQASPLEANIPIGPTPEPDLGEDDDGGEVDDGTAGSAGAAFGVRASQEGAKTDTGQDAPKPGQEAAGQAPASPGPNPPAAPLFDVVDQFGEVMGPFSHAEAIDTLSGLLRRAEGNQEAVDVLREHNADLLAESEPVNHRVGLVHVRGKISASAYLLRLKAAMERQPPDQAWLEAQRQDVEALPATSRLAVLQAVMVARSAHNLDSSPPEWLRVAAGAPPAQPSPHTPEDAQWTGTLIERTLPNIEQMEPPGHALDALVAYAGSEDVTDHMIRLKRDGSSLFARLKAAFDEASGRIRKRMEQGEQQ